jgi:hypothetical protein
MILASIHSFYLTADEIQITMLAVLMGVLLTTIAVHRKIARRYRAYENHEALSLRVKTLERQLEDHFENCSHEHKH